MIDINKLSTEYIVCRLNEKNIDEILTICLNNPLYYECCPPQPDRNGILEDLTVCPKGKTADDKYYVGFYNNNELIALMDLIDGYPQEDIAFIGFFMIKKEYQGKGIGSAIVKELKQYLKESGFQSMRLAWVKANPQSEHFWKKNGLIPFKETMGTDGLPLMLAEVKLQKEE